jgi:thiol:disulfide interchange protein DsbG
MVPRLRCLLAVGLLAAHGLALAHAAPAAVVSRLDAATLVNQASHGAASLVRMFSGVHGLTGAVIKGPNNTENVAWITPDGKAIIVEGTLVGSHGEDLTRSAMYQQGLMVAPAEGIAQAGARSDAIMVGTRGPVLTVFFDPNCIFCHILHKALAKPVAEGKVRVRYVIVAILKPSSLGRAVSILGAKDPAKALQIDEAKFNRSTEEGGYTKDDSSIPAARRAALTAVVKANSALMARLGGTGTPTILFCDAKTASVQMSVGMPPNVAGFVSALGTGPAPACAK